MAHHFTRIEKGFPVCSRHGERCVALYAYKADGGLAWPPRIIGWEHVGGAACDDASGVRKRRRKCPIPSNAFMQSVGA